ncbi:hypothetical protein TIFTF001_000178 [Ficus carica]|uniref:Uncharacterized protein n=1 Tax=Ficus carica TaxID=3494 RepID=A0AA87YWH9_FICCA|nr:hypothetical protein TIFTF001_000178 [Ficus carica]
MKDHAIIVTKSVATSGIVATPHSTTSATVAEFEDSGSDYSSVDDDLSFEEI